MADFSIRSCFTLPFFKISFGTFFNNSPLKVSVLKSETPTPTERTDDLEESMPSSLESNPTPVARQDGPDLTPLSKSFEKGSFST